MLFMITSKIYWLPLGGAIQCSREYKKFLKEHLHTFQLFIHATKINSGHNNIFVLKVLYVQLNGCVWVGLVMVCVGIRVCVMVSAAVITQGSRESNSYLAIACIE